jgi:hypothetical protein
MEALNLYLTRTQDPNQILPGSLQGLQDMELFKLGSAGLGNLPDQLYLNQLAALRNGVNLNTSNMSGWSNFAPNMQGMNTVIQPDYQQQTLEARNYGQEAYHLYLTNNIITNKINELLAEKSQILMRLALLDKTQNPIPQYKLSQVHMSQSKKKRLRRAANQIDRHYRCPITSCAKSYGSEGSLYQHIKLKHPSFNIVALIGKNPH